MSPIIPHYASECLYKFGVTEKLEWPKVDRNKIKKETIEYVIQINGKKRGIISVEKNLQEKDIIKQIKNEKLIDKYLNDGKLIKTIYVKNRLINYIVKL